MSYDAVPLIPRSVLFGNPTYAAPALSPDGTRFGYIAPYDDVLNVWVGPADDPNAARAVTRDAGRGIRVFGFCHDDRTLFYLQDADGDENWRLHLLDLDAEEEQCVTPFEGVQAQVLGHNRWHPTTMLIGLNKDNPELHDVYRLDLTTRELTKVEENPGFVGWLIDTELRVRGGASMTPESGMLFHLDVGADGDVGGHRPAEQAVHEADGAESEAEVQPWLEVPPEDSATTNIIGFSRSGEKLYLISSIQANSARLFEVDLASGEHTLLAEDPAYDIGGVELDPETRTPQAVVYDKDREEWLFLDDEYARAVERVRGQLAALGIDGELGITRSERTDRRWLVSVMPSDGPVRFYLYDRDSAALTFLFSHRPELDDYELAPMEPFAFTARDGVEVHGYVTYPLGVERRDLPAMLNVHGGPWARDSWAYNPEAQWLANRGYVGVQVNFRGSTGYGKAFGNLGDKQWSGTMHADLLDAIDYLVERGTVDRGRVGIMGGSYGGYAALVGAAFTPDVFRCAVDLCGPSNLLTLLASIPPYWKPLLALMYAKVGHPESEKDVLWERSPLSKVDDIRIPVLVAQGANDVRVTQAEAEQIVQALAAKGLPHEYLLFDDEGHGLAKPENRERYYAAVEAFLAEHLGGRSEAAG